MNPSIQEVRLSKSAGESVGNIIVAAASLAMLYYLSNPDKLDRHREAVRGFWDRMQHKASVWQALREIRSLPEIQSNL